MSNSQEKPYESETIEKRSKDYWITQNFLDTPLGKFILYRLIENRDVKMVITSHGSTTGTGKTTLAVVLAKLIWRISKELNESLPKWEAEKYSFIDAYEYLDKYKDVNEGQVLITDELETMVDNRRSPSHENVYFTQAWQMLRYKNVITIGTAPGIHTLDKRVMETADVWINVLAKGVAIPHYVSAHDFTGDPIYKRFTLNDRRTWIRWNKIEDEDYEYLSNLKEEQGVPGMGESVDEDDVKEAERSTKMEITKELIKVNWKNDTPLSQDDMADITGWSQPKISQIVRELRDNET